MGGGGFRNPLMKGPCSRGLDKSTSGPIPLNTSSPEGTTTAGNPHSRHKLHQSFQCLCFEFLFNPSVQKKKQTKKYYQRHFFFFRSKWQQWKILIKKLRHFELAKPFLKKKNVRRTKVVSSNVKNDSIGYFERIFKKRKKEKKNST